MLIPSHLLFLQRRKHNSTTITVLAHPEVNPGSCLTSLTICSVTADESIHFLYLSLPLGTSDLIQLFIFLLFKPNTSFCWWGFLLLLLAADSRQLSALKSEATYILPATDLEFQKKHIPLNESHVTGKVPGFFTSGIFRDTEIPQSGKESIQEVLTWCCTSWYSSHGWPSQADTFSCFIRDNQFGIFINRFYATYLGLYFI